ncbi:MAG: serine/threonine protein kinase [Chroococcidiopsidaceae cyanobacterium CP_BM_ER_R8_30]|nr:serine/threonine protein kinase [Chroococcidiopsidaceae cyanobacterium CP_BM_ER_R8_30]
MQPIITTDTVLQNRYRLTKIVSQGAVERLYLAEDQGRCNNLCTLKELTLIQRDSSLEKAKELFQQEAKRLYQIQHPQVLQFLSIFEQDKSLFLVQEYVEGKTCAALLDERLTIGQTFSEAEILQLFKQLLPVLEHLHGQGMIHRAISPNSIILRERDHLPVLTNFGSIQELVSQFLFPSTYLLTSIGELGYIPAEQIQTGKAYPSSDLYAFAATCVVLLTAQKPQELFDDTQLSWNWQHYVTLSPELDAVLHRMLSYKPSDRYQSVAAVAQALRLSLESPSAQITATNLSWWQSVIGHRPAAVASSTSPQEQLASVISVSKRQLWENPWVVAIIFLIAALLPGVSAWLLVSSRLNPSRSSVQPTVLPQAFPSPLISGTTPTSPSASDSATPTGTEALKSNQSTVTSLSNLNLHTGKRTILRGSLKAHQVEYAFQGEQGQHLSAILIAEGVVLNILGPDRTPIVDGADQVTHYQGRLPATGVYIIELQPTHGISRSRYKLILHLANPA